MNAPRMALEDRQDQILDAVIPAIRDQGSAITSKQLADAAGVAEGTLFRSFGDKESLLKAAFSRASDIAFAIDEVSFDDGATLEEAIEQLAAILVERFVLIFRLAVAIGPMLDGDRSEQTESFEALRDHLAALLEPFRDQLRIAPSVAADALRTLVFSAATGWGEGDSLTLSDVTGILLYGIAAPNRLEEAS